MTGASESEVFYINKETVVGARQTLKTNEKFSWYIIRTQHWQKFIAENTTYFSAAASATAAITPKALIFEVWLYDRQNEIGF